MKKIFITTIFLLWIIFLFGQPEMKFDATVFDYGQIIERTGNAIGEFHFTNIGTDTLIIYNANSTGGFVMVSNYPKKPILPGEKGIISVLTNTSSGLGVFNKSVTIVSNEKSSPHKLSVKGEFVRHKTTIRVDNAKKEQAISVVNANWSIDGQIKGIYKMINNTGKTLIITRVQASNSANRLEPYVYPYSDCKMNNPFILQPYEQKEFRYYSNLNFGNSELFFQYLRNNEFKIHTYIGYVVVSDTIFDCCSYLSNISFSKNRYEIEEIVSGTIFLSINNLINYPDSLEKVINNYNTH